MGLREVEAECAQNRGEGEGKTPSRPRYAPPKDDAEKRRTRRQAERDRWQHES